MNCFVSFFFYYYHKILSKREHLLVVSTENLQDVKKNITEAKEAETQTQESLPENDGFLEDDESQYLLEVKG